MCKKTYIVEDVIEEEYGCEGIPDGEEAMVTVLLRGENGDQTAVRMPDRLAYERKLGPEDTVMLDENGFCQPVV